MSQIKEQITMSVPRGTRAWLKKTEKLGITPEQILRLGITQVGEFISRNTTAKNSETQLTQTEKPNE